MKTKENMKVNKSKYAILTIAIIFAIVAVVSVIYAYLVSSHEVVGVMRLKPKYMLTYEYYEIDTEGNKTKLDKEEKVLLYANTAIELGAEEEYSIYDAEKYQSMDFHIQGESENRQIGYELQMPASSLTIEQNYYLKPSRGNIIVHHYEAGTGVGYVPAVLVAQDETITDEIGKSFEITNLVSTSNKILIDGVELETEREYISSVAYSYSNAYTSAQNVTIGEEGVATGEIVEGNTTITYYYNALKYSITGEVVGGNGTITDGNAGEITEYVLKGANSTKNIILTPNTGYRVKKIMVYTGDEIEQYREGTTEGIGTEIRGFEEERISAVATLEKFENVTQNIHIVVTFEERPFVAQIIGVPLDVVDMVSEQYAAGQEDEENKILNHKYYTLTDAILDAALANSETGETNKLVEIILLDNIRNESILITNENNVSIDLDGHEIYLDSKTRNKVIQVEESSLIVKDSNVFETGVIKSEQGVGIFIASDGEATLGIDRNPISISSPRVEGKTFGIYKEKDTDTNTEGILNFYDGRVVGQTAIYGTVNDKPATREVNVTLNNQTGKNEAFLTMLENKEAVIGKKAYTHVEDAINEANTIYGKNGEPIEVDLITDAVVEASMEIMQNRNITFDLNGNTLSSQSTPSIFTNNGNLIIKDSTDEDFDYNLTRTTSKCLELNEEDKLLVSNVKYQTASGYVPLDLTSYSGNVTITVNAELSKTADEVGFAKIKTNRVTGDSTGTDGMFMSINKNTQAADYTTTVQGGTKYFLHLGLSDYTSGEHENSFKVNSVKINNQPIKIRSEKGVITKSTGIAITNNGTLTINDGKIIAENVRNTGTIVNYSNLTINAGYIYSNGYGSVPIHNLSGSNCTMNGGSLLSDGTYGSSIWTEGNVTINEGACLQKIATAGSGTITFKNGLSLVQILNQNTNSQVTAVTVENGDIKNIDNNANAKVKITGTNLAEYTQVTNNGAMEITGGNFYKVTNNSVLDMSGGTIKNDNIAIKAQGSSTRTNISGGTIYGTVSNSGSVMNLSGNVKVTTEGVTTVSNASNGIINIQGGTYIQNGTDSTAIENSSNYNANGAINIGIKNTAQNTEVSQTNPSIKSKGYGIKATSGGINFYDGEVITPVGKEVIGTINEIEEYDSEAHKLVVDISTINNMQGYEEYNGYNRMTLQPATTAAARILKSSISAENIATLTNDKYYTYTDEGNEYYAFYLLEDAMKVCSTSAGNTQTTIELMKNINVVDGLSALAGQNIAIDLKGNTINYFGNDILIVNNGTLEIKNTESTGMINSKGRIAKNNATGKLTLNVNAEVTTQDLNIIDNIGELTINGGTITGYKSKIIYNTGTLTVNDGTINGMNAVYDINIYYSDSTNIVNTGSAKCEINGGTLYNNSTGQKDSGTCILNEGTSTVKITGGTFNAPRKKCIINTSVSKYVRENGQPETDAAVYITGGTFQAGNDQSAYAVYDGSSRESDIWIKKDATKTLVINKQIIIDSANLTMNNVTTTYSIIANGAKSTITDCNLGTISFANDANGNVSSNTNEDIINGGTISNVKKGSLGTLQITNATINGQVCNKNAGTVTINNSTVTATTDAIDNIGTGTIHITSVGNTEIKSTSNSGIYNESTGTIILGNKGDTVNTIYPKIIGATYGLYSKVTSGQFKFYDGSITGSRNNSINSNTTRTDLEEGYDVVVNTNADGITETAILGLQTVVKILKSSIIEDNLINLNINYKSSDPNYYEFYSLQDAINGCTDGTQTTIILIRNLNFSQNATTTTVPSTKNIIVELNGLNMITGNENSFANAGTLKIIDSSGAGTVSSNTGSITANKKGFITNTGTLEIDKVKINIAYAGTSSEFANFAINTSGSTITLTNNIVSLGSNLYNNLIKNSGTAIITGGTYTADKGKNDKYIIYNENSGDATISNASLQNMGWYNTGTATLEAIDTNVTAANIYNYSTKVSSLNNKPAMKLKGGTYNLSTDFSYGYITFNIYNYAGETVIENSTTNIGISGWNWATKTVLFANGGTIKINSGNFRVNLTASNGGEIIINDGTFNGENTFNFDVSNNSTASILGGTFVGCIMNNNGTLTIGNNNGTISQAIPEISCNTNDESSYFKSTGTLNFYDGKISYLNKVPVIGNVDNIPANSEIIYTINNNIHTYTLSTTDIVATIGEGSGIQQFTTLEGAFASITTSNHTQIDLQKSVGIIKGNEFTIGSNKDITLNLNGNTIIGNGDSSVLFTNEGDFEIADTSGGAIISYGTGVVENTGNLTISGGILTIRENTQNRTIIENTGTGTVEVTGGEMSVQGYYESISVRVHAYCIYSTSTGNVTLTGGSYECIGEYSKYEAYVLYVSSTTTKPTITIGGNTLITNQTYSYGFYVNNVNLNITGGINNCATNGNVINNSVAAISGGTIVGNTSIDANSTVTISGAQTQMGSVVNSGTVTVTGGTFTGRFTNNKIASFENTIISTTDTYALHMNNISAETDIRKGTTIETTNNSTNDIAIYIQSGTCRIYEGEEVNSEFKDVIVTSQGGTGIYNSSGTLILGTNILPVNITTPKITGATYGVNNKGTFKFYDGRIKGIGNAALTGTAPSDLPTNYAVQTYENGTLAVLENSAQTISVASVNGVTYQSLQTAINATTEGEITIEAYIELDEPITIPSGKNLIINLNSFYIEYSGSNAAITNSGSLTIVDYNEDGTSISDYSIIRNRVGPAITNNGTLTIGKDDDGTIYTNSPRIIGATYGVVNASGATFRFYDGVLKGATAAVSGTITNYSTVSGYTYTTENEIIGNVTYQIAYYKAN